jgi:hypothetical protein
MADSKENNSMMYIVAIVAIIAIVALVIMIKTYDNKPIILGTSNAAGHATTITPCQSACFRYYMMCAKPDNIPECVNSLKQCMAYCSAGGTIPVGSAI